MRIIYGMHLPIIATQIDMWFEQFELFIYII